MALGEGMGFSILRGCLFPFLMRKITFIAFGAIGFIGLVTPIAVTVALIAVSGIFSLWAYSIHHHTENRSSQGAQNFLGTLRPRPAIFGDANNKDHAIDTRRDGPRIGDRQ